MTTEQAIVLGFIAAAFVFGWLARAMTEWASRSRRRAKATAKLTERVESAADESRRELERAIRAYHATVARHLGDDGVEQGSADGTLDTLAQALYALALAVGHASSEVQQDLPLAARLRQTGSELRTLAQEVLAYSTQPDPVPNGMFDRLEQQLTTAVSTLLVPATEARPA
jgi:hypothetical protein